MPQHDGETKPASEESGEHQERTDEDKKDKKREYNEAELKRLRESMRQEADKIHKPKRELFTPYTFNSLDPYFDVSNAEFVHAMRTDVRHGYSYRSLATGLCDPEIALRMDAVIPDKPPSRIARSSPQQHRRRTKSGDDRPPSEGSTRLPTFPAVQFSMSGMPKKKQYNFNDVPTLRQEVQEQCSVRGSKKIDEDYKRTKADFYRMELDKMNEYSAINRPHMRAAYFAYLQNTAGSRKALHECVRTVEGGGDGKRTDRDDKDKDKKQEDSEKADETKHDAAQSGDEESKDGKRLSDKGKSGTKSEKKAGEKGKDGKEGDAKRADDKSSRSAKDKNKRQQKK